MANSFSELIGGKTPVLVDFYAEWCGPCKAMKPVLEELKTRVGEKARIIKVDVDKSPRAASEYQVRGVPTLILFKEGAVKWRQSGVVSAGNLERIIMQYV